jgi:nucleoside-diphosphate-sugar epimerase
MNDSCKDKKTVLLTGATGNISSKLATRILTESADTRLLLLVRATSEAEGFRRVECLPAAPKTTLDIVPADYDANAIWHILGSTKGCTGRICHLAAGEGRALSIGEIVDRAVACYNMAVSGQQSPTPRFVASGSLPVPTRTDKLAALGNGNRITFDFVPPELVDNETEYKGNRKLIEMCASIGEPLTFGCQPC